MLAASISSTVKLAIYAAVRSRVFSLPNNLGTARRVLGWDATTASDLLELDSKKEVTPNVERVEDSKSRKRRECHVPPSRLQLLCSFFHDEMKCDQCYTDSPENKPHMVCSACRGVKYCSAKCQKKHWKAHRETCAHTKATLEAIKLDSVESKTGLSLQELDARLERWLRCHADTLMEASIHALKLHEAVANARSQIFRVGVVPREDHEGVTSKYFRVEAVATMAISDAMALGRSWAETLKGMERMREESERGGHGTMAAVSVDCRPLVQFLPCGSITRALLESLAVDLTWRETMMNTINA